MLLIRFLVPGLAALALAGCAWSSVGQHVAASDYRGDPRRIFIIDELDLRMGAVDIGMPLKSALAACGVTTAVAQFGGVQLDLAAKLNAAIAQFRPDAIMIIHVTNSLLQMHAVVSDNYLLTLADVTTKREIWKGVVGWTASVVRDREPVAKDFADKIVGKLVDDGILKSCSVARWQT